MTLVNRVYLNLRSGEDADNLERILNAIQSKDITDFALLRISAGRIQFAYNYRGDTPK